MKCGRVIKEILGKERFVEEIRRATRPNGSVNV